MIGQIFDIFTEISLLFTYFSTTYYYLTLPEITRRLITEEDKGDWTFQLQANSYFGFLRVLLQNIVMA